MQPVEALREVKRAEDEVKRLKEEAARKAAEEIRTSERRATELIERAKADADAVYAQGIQAAQDAVSKDRQKIVKAGESEAQALSAKVNSPDFNRAVELVLANFEKRVGGRK